MREYVHVCARVCTNLGSAQCGSPLQSPKVGTSMRPYHWHPINNTNTLNREEDGDTAELSQLTGSY